MLTPADTCAVQDARSFRQGKQDSISFKVRQGGQDVKLLGASHHGQAQQFAAVALQLPQVPVALQGCSSGCIRGR